MHAVLALVMMTTAAVLPHSRVGHGPAVVLVHGMNTNRHLWDELVPRLARTHTVIAVDLPGMGEAPAEKTVDVDDLARRIAATVRAEKVGPAVIVGHSMGGTITGHVPLVAPEVTRAIVIVDSSIGPAPWTEQDLDGLRAALKQHRDQTLRGFFAPICQPSQLDKLLAMGRALPDDTRLAYFAALMKRPVADGGRAIGVPVLLMASKLLLPGKKPRAAELADAGYAHVRDLTVEYFDRSLHYLMWDEPDKLADTLSKFLTRVEAHR